jgi:hypothetical protein
VTTIEVAIGTDIEEIFVGGTSVGVVSLYGITILTTALAPFAFDVFPADRNPFAAIRAGS